MDKFKAYESDPNNEMVVDLNQFVPESHLSKRMEKIVSTLDTSMIEANYSELGQNALHPKMLLSIIFYGYAIGIRSGRKLSRACMEQLPFLYLSKGYCPKKTCINEFRKRNYLCFPDLFIQVLKRCQKTMMGDADLWMDLKC